MALTERQWLGLDDDAQDNAEELDFGGWGSDLYAPRRAASDGLGDELYAPRRTTSNSLDDELGDELDGGFADRGATRAPRARTGDARQDFVNLYGDMAESVGERLGVAPELLLGQWALESDWGRRTVGKSHNLGNIKDPSGRGPKGRDNMNGSVDSYRAYESPDAFGDDFARLVGTLPRYAGALDSGADEGRYFAALKKGGYAEDPDYVAKGSAVARQVRALMGQRGERSPVARRAVGEDAEGDGLLPTAMEFGHTRQPAPTTRSVGERAQDAGLSLAGGAVGAVGALASLLGADNAVARGLDDAGKYLEGSKSEGARVLSQQSQDRIAMTAGQGTTAEVGAYLEAVWDNPVDMTMGALGSLIPFAFTGGGGAIIARGAQAAQAARAAGMTQKAFLATEAGAQLATTVARGVQATNVAMGAGMGAGGVKQAQYETTEREALASGKSAQEAGALAAQAQAYGVDNLLSHAGGAVLGGVAVAVGPLEKGLSRIGAGPAARALANKGAPQGVLRATAQGAAAEALPEGLQAAQQALSGNQAAIRAGVMDANREYEGVAGKAVQDAVVSAPLGGASGFASRGQAQAPAAGPQPPAEGPQPPAEGQQPPAEDPIDLQPAGDPALPPPDSTPGQLLARRAPAPDIEDAQVLRETSHAQAEAQRSASDQDLASAIEAFEAMDVADMTPEAIDAYASALNEIERRTSGASQSSQGAAAPANEGGSTGATLNAAQAQSADRTAAAPGQAASGMASGAAPAGVSGGGVGTSRVSGGGGGGGGGGSRAAGAVDLSAGTNASSAAVPDAAPAAGLAAGNAADQTAPAQAPADPLEQAFVAGARPQGMGSAYAPGAGAAAGEVAPESVPDHARQAMDLIAQKLSTMRPGDVAKAAIRYLPTVGQRGVASKQKNTAMLTNPQGNLLAVAAELGVQLPAQVRQALTNDMVGGPRTAPATGQSATRSPNDPAPSARRNTQNDRSVAEVEKLRAGLAEHEGSAPGSLQSGSPEAVRQLAARRPALAQALERARATFDEVADSIELAFGWRPQAILGLPGSFGIQYQGTAYVNLEQLAGADSAGNAVRDLVLFNLGHEVTHNLEKSADAQDRADYKALHSAILEHARDGVVAHRAQAEGRGADYGAKEVVADVSGAMWLDPRFWQRLYEIDDGSTMRRIAYKIMEAAAKLVAVVNGSRLDVARFIAGEGRLESVRVDGKTVDLRPYVTAQEQVREVASQVWAARARRAGALFTPSKGGQRTAGGRANFEVAPDPNNAALSERWGALPLERKIEISREVAQSVLPQVLALHGAEGAITEQTGSYLEDTNPSFALKLTRGDVQQVSKDLGYVLSQDSMMNLALEPFEGSAPVGAVLLDVGALEFDGVKALYDELRAAIPQVGGQSTTDGIMTILNYSDLSTEALTSLVDRVVGGRHDVRADEVHSSFPEKKDYDYDNQGNDAGVPGALARVAGRRLGAIRREAADAIERALERGPSHSRAERGRVARGSGSARGRSAPGKDAAPKRAVQGPEGRLEGAPSVRGFSGPDPRLVSVAQRYARARGIPFKRQAEYVQVDEARARRLADAYAQMEHAPQEPRVAAAYADLIAQTTAQYQALVEEGYQFWFIDIDTERGQEYAASPWNAMRDIRANQRMGVFPTEGGFGSSDADVSDNPLLADTGLRWPMGGPGGPLKPVLANDLFRAVHDAFGHGLEGAGFRAQGEENAWQAHVRLFTGPAVAAITSETRGQNSWLNYGPHGEANRSASAVETIFADQKTGLLPEWAWTEGITGDQDEVEQGTRGGAGGAQGARGLRDGRARPDAPSRSRGGDGADGDPAAARPRYGRPRPGAVSAIGVHFSREPRQTLDSNKYGTGLRGEEANRLWGLDDIRPRVFFYVDTGQGVRPETGVGSNAHEVQLDNIYDAVKDGLGLVRDTRGMPGIHANNWERAVLQAGFDGYLAVVPGASMGHVVLVGQHQVPVARATPRLATSTSTATAPAPDPYRTRFNPRSDTLVRRLKGGNELLQVEKARNAGLKEAVPSFHMEFGEIHVAAADAEAANAFLADFPGTAAFDLSAVPDAASRAISRSREGWDDIDDIDDSAFTNALDLEDDFDSDFDSDFGKDEDLQAELQAELQAQMRAPLAAPALTDQAVQQAGLMVEDVFTQEPAMGGFGSQGVWAEAPAYADRMSAVVEMEYVGDGQHRVIVRNAHRTTFLPANALNQAQTKDFIRRQMAAHALHKRGVDLLDTQEPRQIEQLVQGWRQIAKVPGAFKLKRASTSSEDFSTVAANMRAFRGYEVQEEQEDNVTGLQFRQRATGRLFAAHFQDHGTHIECCTLGLAGSSGLGVEFYAVMAEVARNRGQSFEADTSLSGINAYRRTEQALSYALKSGDTGVLLPGPQNRVYGFDRTPQNEADHDRNIARLALAGMRNVMELVPSFARLRYDLKTDRFTGPRGGDAERDVKDILADTAARTFGLGRSSLARAVLSRQMLDGQQVQAQAIASPIAYSMASAEADLPLSESWGSEAEGAQGMPPQLREFMRDSAVVDERGLPLVVYHGTVVRDSARAPGMGDIQAFDRMFTTQFRAPSLDTVGSWFSTNPGDGGAEMYSGRYPGSAIYPVFLSIKNPHVTTFALMQRRARLLHNGKDDGRKIGAEEVQALRSWLQAMDKDGIKIEGSGNDGSTEFDRQVAWIALEPGQIKSAIGNNGDYDRTNPAISRSSSDRAEHFIAPRQSAKNGAGPSNLAAARLDPRYFTKIVEAVAGHTGIRAASLEETLEANLQLLTDNLLALHDAAMRVSAPAFKQATQWYVGGNRIAARFAQDWGVSVRNVAAMLAVTSPSMDWFRNVDVAKRLGNFLSGPAATAAWDAQMEDVARTLIDRAEDAKARAALQGQLDGLRGKPYAEMEPGIEQALWYDLWDRAHQDTSHPMVSPEGEFLDLATTAAGAPKQGLRQSVSNLGKAIQAFHGERLSDALGAGLKVRNFYNNLANPSSADAVTMDTHAIAAAHLQPFSNTSPAVSSNFGSPSSAATGLSGTYPVYVEAYERAARARGLLPREMQSITWEAIRTLFPASGGGKFNKRSAKQAVPHIWSKHDSTPQGHEAARAEVLGYGGGIKVPGWFRPDHPAAAQVGAAGVAGGLAGPGADAQRQPLRGPDARGEDRGSRGAAPARLTLLDGQGRWTQERQRPDEGFSRSKADPYANYSAQQRASAEKIFGAKVQPDLRTRVRQMADGLGVKMRQGLVDQFAPIKDLDPLAYLQARMSRGTDGAVEAALLYGKPFLRDGVLDVDVKDTGFAKVLADLKGEHDRFFQWVAALRAERISAERAKADAEIAVIDGQLVQLRRQMKATTGAAFVVARDAALGLARRRKTLDATARELLFDGADISALKGLAGGAMADGRLRFGTYHRALRQLNDFNESVLRVALDSGLIDQDAYDLMKAQPYVPFYRLMEDGDIKGARFSSGLVNQQAWHKLKGGTRQLNEDLLQNMLLNWGAMYAASARNRSATATLEAARRAGIARVVPSDTKGAVQVRRAGLAEHWAVDDVHLLDAIAAISYMPGGFTSKVLAPFKRWLTFGVTVNPTFKVRNLMRDTLSAMAQSDLGYNPLDNVAKGWAALGKDSQTRASMLASGGMIRFGTQENSNRARHLIEGLGGRILDKQGWAKLTGQLHALWSVYDELGDKSENANRARLYERLVAKGHSHAEAAFMSRDLMDFSMSGQWEVVRFLTQTVPFLNARLQGLYKLGRAARQDPRRFFAVTGAVAVASIALMAANADDEDWKKREDWDRDTYWWFKIGDTAFRIPKPFEVGAIGTLAERTAEWMFSKEMTGERFAQRIKHMVSQTFAMDPTPQLLKPLLDVYANRDSFTGRPIEGMADERLLPEDRYNERTSEAARLLGRMGLPDPTKLVKGDYEGLSPKQIDSLLRGYFGWLATVGTTATDLAVRPLMDRGERPALQLRDAPVVGNFAEQLPTASSRYVSAMYEQARAIEQVWASHQAALKAGDTDRAEALEQAHGDKLERRAAVEQAKKVIARLSAQARGIEADADLSATDKREALLDIGLRKHEAALQMMGRD